VQAYYSVAIITLVAGLLCFAMAPMMQAQAPGSFVTTSDGTDIFYKDWGTGQPLFFHHGWPLSADDRDGARSVRLLKRGTLKSYPGLPHGMPTTHAELINADLLEFIKTG
jgi:hypothetical protein